MSPVFLSLKDFSRSKRSRSSGSRIVPRARSISDSLVSPVILFLKSFFYELFQHHAISSISDSLEFLNNLLLSIFSMHHCSVAAEPSSARSPAMDNPPNNNIHTSIVRAQIVFLLLTLTEDNFDRNQAEIRSVCL